MTFATPTHAFTRPPPRDERLDLVIAATERNFLDAGDSLAEAVETLRITRDLFARLDESLGEETGRRLADLIAHIFSTVEGVREGFDAFLAQSDDLRTAVRSVRVEVGELDRVVRTISNVSINARILGNALMPPRPQVNSFIERLAQMASEAETILGEVKDAMSGIGQDIATMDQSLQELRQDLMYSVLPALGRFGAFAQKVQDGRAEMTRVSAELDTQTTAIAAEVSRLVMALQAGDSTRQRLNRVQDVLAAAARPDTPAGLDAVLLDLARALIDGARTDAESEVSVSIAALQAVRTNADQAMQQARSFYFARAGADRKGTTGPDTLDEGFARVRRHLALMRSRSEDLRTHLDVILRHEITIRQIAQLVRLSGLNAVLICAKLGEEGRSLRELAQWLRALTDESDAIVHRLQGNLANTRTRAHETGEVGVARLEQALCGFMRDTGGLNAAMLQIDSVVAEAARGFDSAGRQLPLHLAQAGAWLNAFRAALWDLDGLGGTLAAQRATLPAPATPFAPDSAEHAVLAGLRARYTMQQERAIHDTVTLALHDGTPPPAPPEAAADTTLDDILF